MGTLVFDANAPRIRGTTPNEDYLVEPYIADYDLSDGRSVLETFKDIQVLATYGNSRIVRRNVQVNKGPACGPVVLSTDDPSKATVNQAGEVSFISPGFVKVICESASGRREFLQFLEKNSPSPTYGASTLLPGTLRYYLRQQQTAALQGAIPGATSQRATVNGSVWAPGGAGGVNPANFLWSAPKTGLAAYPSDVVEQYVSQSATGWKAWITPHHFLCWKGHGVTHSPGASWRSIDGEVAVEYSATRWNGTLCKLFPSTLNSWLPTGPFEWVVPCWSLVWNTYIETDGSPLAERRWLQPIEFGRTDGKPFPVGDERRAFQKFLSTDTQMMNSGDSGSPVFCNVMGTVVPITHVANQGVFGRPQGYHTMRPAIDAALAELNGSGLYTAQTVDLSSFPTFA
jgi:hypothetical protein